MRRGLRRSRGRRAPRPRRRAGIGAGLFGGAGLIALYGLGVLIAAIVLLLATAIEPWIAAVIVAVVFGLGGLIKGTFQDSCTRIAAGDSSRPAAQPDACKSTTK